MNLNKSWGWTLLLDLYDCRPNLMKDTMKMKDFIRMLCRNIEMERHKKTRIERFGEGEILGYSLHQFIKTSGIEVHYEEYYGNQVMLTLTSCKNIKIKKVIEFSLWFYGGKVLGKPRIIPRGHK